MESTTSKLLAYYLPQFHTFEENDRWWGKGFTEWRCVKRSSSWLGYLPTPRPHPDIGYYCLEELSIRERQAAMARKYGIFGFCYYHYWFGGKLLMQRILEQMLVDGQPDLPFCLCWANEPWTRRMNRGDGGVLQPAAYGGESEWEAHLEYLVRFFRHRNYIKLNNRPLLVIYRVSQIPDFALRFAFWRKQIRRHGFDDLFLVMTLGNFHHDVFSSMTHAVDACVEFFPNFLGVADAIKRTVGLRRKIAFYDMDEAYERILSYPQFHERQFRGMLTGFNSYPRAGWRSNVFMNGSPEKFGKALRKQLARSSDELLFINAWNEWGEGACLEPDTEHGYAYLEEVRRSLQSRLLPGLPNC